MARAAVLELWSLEGDDVLADILAGRELRRHFVVLSTVMILCAALYGAVFGMWHGAELSFYVAVKLPLVLLLTSALTVVFAWTAARILGLALGFGQVAVLTFLALSVASLLLASLAPVAWLFTFCAPAPTAEARTLLLCVPSLYVFSSLAGARWNARSFLAVLAGFAGILALLMAALLPISWLFSVSSRYLGSVVWLHVALWLLALAIGWRFLGRVLAELGARGMFLWLLLFGLVSFQATTFLRPVLWREAGTPLFRTGEKMFFLEHFGKALTQDEEAGKGKNEKKEAGTAPAEKGSGGR